MNATAPKKAAQHAKALVAHEGQVAQLVAYFASMDDWGRELVMSTAARQAKSHPQERAKHLRLLDLFGAMADETQEDFMCIADVLADKFPKKRPALRLVV
jgi:hypothetical protein